VSRSVARMECNGIRGWRRTHPGLFACLALRAGARSTADIPAISVRDRDQKFFLYIDTQNPCIREGKIPLWLILESGTWRRSGVYLRLNLLLLRERARGRHRPGPPKAQHARKRSGKRTAADVDSGERPPGGPPKGIGRCPDRADGPTLSGYRTEGRRSDTRPPPYFFACRDVGTSRSARTRMSDAPAGKQQVVARLRARRVGVANNPEGGIRGCRISPAGGRHGMSLPLMQEVVTGVTHKVLMTKPCDGPG